jgi:hypothetical protein
VILIYATSLCIVVRLVLVRVFDQTPHSMYWAYDAIGYIAMGLATLVAAQTISGEGFDRWVRRSLLANARHLPST